MIMVPWWAHESELSDKEKTHCGSDPATVLSGSNLDLAAAHKRMVPTSSMVSTLWSWGHVVLNS